MFSLDSRDSYTKVNEFKKGDILVTEMTDPDLIVTNPILYNGLTPTNNPDPTSAITLTWFQL